MYAFAVIIYDVDTIIVSCFLILILYRMLSQKNKRKISDKLENKKIEKKEDSSDKLVSNFTVKDSIKLVFKSKYLFYLAVIVFSYNFVFNILDVIWTNQLRLEFNNNPEQISLFMSKLTMAKGLLATFLALFVQ